MRVAIAGDWHADDWFALRVLDKIREKGVTQVLHVGDLGIGLRSGFEDALEIVLKQYKMHLWVTPGNHDNYNLIDSLEKCNKGVGKLTDHISVLPRGHRWVWDEVSFLSVGGAASIDRRWRTPELDWWPQELITQEDVDRATEPGHVDVLICHDAPMQAGDIETMPAGYWPLEDEKTSRNQRKLLGEVVEQVKPLRVFHGHHHFRYDKLVEEIGTWIHGLADNSDPKRNWVILDGTKL